MTISARLPAARSGRKIIGLAGLVFLSGCMQDMWNGSRLKPLEKSPLFPDGNSARPLVAGTVARGQAHLDTALYEGRENSPRRALVTQFPFPITRALLDRGQERFDIFCAPCHGRTGEGNGMIVQRGFSPPPSYYTDRLRKAPVGHFYDVITHGWGTMYSYNDRVNVNDRWAIVAYIRVLQSSRSDTPPAAPPGQRQQPQGAQP